MLKLPIFSLQSACPLPCRQPACLTCSSSPRFYTEPFWGVALFSLCCRTILIDQRLMRLSNGALCCVEWHFGKWKAQCMCMWTVHALIKSREVQQHPYWRTYRTCTVVTCRLSSILPTTSIHMWKLNATWKLAFNSDSTEIHCIHSNRLASLLSKEVDFSTAWINPPSIWRGRFIHTMDKWILG